MGGDLDAFWHQTPRTFAIFISARLKSQSDALKRIEYQAWLTAKLVGFAEVPDFEDVFKRHRSRDDPIKMQSVARMIAASGWGTFIEAGAAEADSAETDPAAEPPETPQPEGQAL